ncbi:SDR family oxidoreductase [Phytomonospora endophytica]|uniref:NAD(P)-dependent dehydrogenase (Short-subunit alcohol dehydrogenase family) n=1 Tax=Phytomonospora endophytica TaxID=714109 RepID=A0A841FT12_9ACTN|nr:SDR family oxidoreductase [Phytomonospora endophytica]MBB6039176.1 NAD(P)-dependent dehydrogenase (short-subunit alcohol dehydrogenase family) [Phytomonospora endophytica]GIG67587.1 oxidoreductase [Phytomonospora endophytica]
MAGIDGKKAIVTGGTHGMGLGIVEALLAGGAEVILTGRNERTVEEARTALAGRAAHVVRSDAASMADIDALGALAAERLGGVDALFVNHGIAEIQTLEQVTEESWDRHFRVNAKGAFFTVQRLAPLLTDGGAVVFTTVANDLVFPGLSAYSGSKEAVSAAAKVLAAELLPRRIRVNSVAPGFIKTPTMGVPGRSAEERAEFERQGDLQTPLGRHGTVAEVAAAALFLAFDATFTTAAEFPIDGGFAQGIAAPA